MSGNGTRAYEDIYDAINADLALAGVSRKEMAMILWPGRRPETAMGLLSRAMNADNIDVHLSPEHIFAIIRRTGGQNIIYAICDFARYERPVKKTDARLKDEMRLHMEQLLAQIRDLAKTYHGLGVTGE